LCWFFFFISLNPSFLPFPAPNSPQFLEVIGYLIVSKMDIDGDVEDVLRRVQVRFFTKLQPPFKAPTTSIALPSNLTRMGLSAVVNNLLQSGNDDWKPEPFDFLIDGELVRMSLEDFLLAKGISAEKTLEIEYIKAVAPRKEEDPSLHDDWVSAVDGSNRFILTGCYDGLGRIWKAAGVCTHILEGHNDAITSVRVVKAQDNENDTNLVVATGSKDKTVKLWKFDAEPSAEDMKIRAFRTLRGHTASVQSLAAQPTGDMVCSGSWDCRINLWQTESNDGGDIVSTKKRKKGNKEEEAQSEGEAVSTLVGHTQCVSSVVWPEHGTIYSASWDHSFRRWDFCGKVINCIDVGGERTLAPSFQFSSHTSWITACKWHSRSWFHLLSASYDGKVMLWDLRTAWPLAIIDSHEDKVLCADWWKGDSVVSGGADSKLRVSSEISIP
ncbi:G-protein beta WD-40 repeat-containing protein, partial [Cynara cardunculus var. scolymus]